MHAGGCEKLDVRFDTPIVATYTYRHNRFRCQCRLHSDGMAVLLASTAKGNTYSSPYRVLITNLNY